MMSNLSMVEATLPPGFRFHPRDEELIWDYLMKKATRNCEPQPPPLIEVDLNKCEPWDIPEMACVGGKEWYFYSQRDRKYATGLRTNRATVSGYWKATGKDRPILRKRSLVGMRKTLVFYQGRAPKGKKTDWVMHEFRLEGHLGPPKAPSSKEDWVLCRVFYKNRDVPPGKQGMGSSSYDEISSSSLPPLMDPYSITFDPTQTQTQPNPSSTTNTDEYEQVPCFSIFTGPNQYHQTFSHMTTHTHIMDPNPSLNKSLPPTFGSSIPDPTDIDSYLNPISFSYEKKSIKAVLSQYLNKMDNMKDQSPSLGEGISDQSFISDVGLPTSATMWYHY